MPWLTPTVFRQAPGESLTQLPRFDDGPERVRFRHIVHIYRDKVVPDNTAIQSITFDTIRQALQYARPDFQVAPVMVAFPEDVDLIPRDMIKAPVLAREAADVAQFASPRRLPLLFDVLRHGMAAETGARSDTDTASYVVFTNSDIHLQPIFYRALAALLRLGYDTICVNRRTIDAAAGQRAFSPLFMADAGRDHLGFDCFAFPAASLEHFAVNHACCGAGGVMRSMLFNLAATARRFLMLSQAHLTFHLGDDMFWQDAQFDDYRLFNYREAVGVLAKLMRDPGKAARVADFVNAHEAQHYRDALEAMRRQGRA
jgi:hypothetical protein